MTPQAWARGPDFLIVQPCSSAYCRAARMYRFGWSATGVSALFVAGVSQPAIIPCWHGLAKRRRRSRYPRPQQEWLSKAVGKDSQMALAVRGVVGTPGL